MPYTVIIHSSRVHAIVSSLNGGPGFVARFAPNEAGDWTTTSVTWHGAEPSREQQRELIERAREVLMARLCQAGVPVGE